MGAWGPHEGPALIRLIGAGLVAVELAPWRNLRSIETGRGPLTLETHKPESSCGLLRLLKPPGLIPHDPIT